MSTPMMSLLATGGASVAPTVYTEDVFFVSTRVGTGASSSVTGGPNLASYDGVVITKARDSSSTAWAVTDTVRGVTKALNTGATAAQTTDTTGLTAFNSDGFTLGVNTKYNASSVKFVDYVFRKSAKFMDIVTYTGNGAIRTIPHSLGAVPNLIIFKRTDAVGGWFTYSGGRVNSNVEYTIMDGSATNSSSTIWNSTLPTSSVFSLGAFSGGPNTVGGTYVAYIFANNTDTSGLIRTETLLTDSSGNAEVNVGWDSQYLLMANISDGSDWIVVDTMRGFPAGTGRVHLSLNSSSAVDSSQPDTIVTLTSTGFKITSGWANAYVLWMLVRKPNKPPKTGTQVYSAIARTGSGAVANVTGVGFTPDMVMGKSRASGGISNFTDNIRGVTNELVGSATTAETAYANDLTSFLMDGFAVGTGASGNKNTNASAYIEHCFKRGPGVFDIAVDTGTGSAHTIPHALGVVPELILRKSRSGSTAWTIYAAGLANTETLSLSTTAAKATAATAWNSTTPTASVFTVGTLAAVNTSAATYVSYLFASKVGISKVGTYTGNGTNQTINCSFTAGARFVLIKRVDSTGDWYIWDTVRGITAGGSDPHISVNTTVAEVTTDSSIDPASSGFIVNQVTATNINVSSATYIYLAFA